MKEIAFSQLGAVVAVLFYISAILVFILRMAGQLQWNRAAGIFELCLALPVLFLLIKAPAFNRPLLFYIQLILVLIWLVTELLLDYILKVEFRQIRWLLISYVTLFFAASGGLIGVAANAGRGWMLVSVILFLAMAALAFIQRRLTGM